MQTFTHFSKSDIEQFEQRYRTAFVNSISGFKPLGLIGTQNREGATNLAIFNSFFHLGANPALIGFVCRPDSVDRHTLTNIQDTLHYTINHVAYSFYKEAHQTSARYEREQSEFDVTHLTAGYKTNFQAPFVEESSVRIGLKLADIIRVPLNGTLIVAGSVEWVEFDTSALQEDGHLLLSELNGAVGTGLDGYHQVITGDRLSYAKPFVESSSISLKKID